jgi:protein subunit release factor B
MCQNETENSLQIKQQYRLKENEVFCVEQETREEARDQVWELNGVSQEGNSISRTSPFADKCKR